MTLQFRRLQELCLSNIERVNPAETPSDDFWYVDISSVDKTTKTISTPTLTKGSASSVRARQVIRSKDVLVSTTRPNLNTVSLVPEKYDEQICSTGFCVLRCGEKLDPDYLFYFTQCCLFINSLSSLVQGALYPAVTDKQVFHQTIPWCSIVKQRQIAARIKDQLAEVYKARQAAEAQLQNAKSLAVRYRENIIKLTADAPRAPLGELLFGIEAGKSFKTNEIPARPNELGVLKVSAVSWNEFWPQEAKGIEGEYQPDESHRVRRGDLLISRANTLELVGAVVRVDADYPMRLLSDKTLRLVVNEGKALPDYLLTILRCPEARKHIENNATGTSDSMRNISQKTIRTIPIPMLSLEKQREIVKQAKSINRELHLIENAGKAMVNDINLLPQKILNRAFAQ